MKNSLLALLVFCIAILSLSAGLSRAEEISGVSSEYTLAVSEDGQLKLDFSWPLRFGRHLSTVQLKDLDLRKAEVTPVDGGAMKGSWIVIIPTRGDAKAIAVESWGKRDDEVFPKTPDRTTLSDELSFHCLTKSDAGKVLSALREPCR